jgi:ubiquinone/menaquinone biosynthesis C-methylase UbiE
VTNYNFDRVSDQYDTSRGMPAGVPEQICQWVRSRLPEDPAITEIGVGTGRIAVPFIRQDVRYTGLDISEQMVARLREKLGGDLHRAQIHLADITEQLPVPEQSQDAVIAVHILHLVDPARTLPQVRRILKPGGALVWGYETHDDDAPRQRIREYFRQTVAKMSGAKWRPFHPPAAQALLAEWGARVEKHTVAAWTAPETPREALMHIAERTMSFTWELDDAAIQVGLRVTESWAQQEFADLDRAYAVQKRFLVDWYQF